MNKDKKFRVRFNYFVEVDIAASNKDEAYDMAMAVLDSNRLEDIAGYDSSEVHELTESIKQDE